jgi:hypothetical protein
MTKDECGMTKGRRGFLKGLAGLVMAPAVPVWESPKTRMSIVGVDLAVNPLSDSVQMVLVMNRATGKFELFTCKVTGGETIEMRRVESNDD